MARAQARLKGLAMAAKTAMSVVKGLALGFLGLGSIFAGFAIGGLFKKIFGEAVQQAEEAEQRTKKLTGALMANAKMRKLGMDIGVQQTKLLQDHNEQLSKQQVFSGDILDTMTAQMALYKLSPKRLSDASAIMADQLAFSKGARATEEDALGLAEAHGRAIMKGQVKGLEKYGVYLSKNEAKEFASLAKAGQIEQAHKRLLGIYQKLSAGRAAAERLTPTGRIVEFQKAIHQLSQDLGKEMLPVMADIADAWREALPALKPVLLGTMRAIGAGIKWAADQFKIFIDYMKTPPAVAAWQELKDAFSGLAIPLKELADALGLAVPQGKSFGEILGTISVAVIKDIAGSIRDFAEELHQLSLWLNQVKRDFGEFGIGVKSAGIWMERKLAGEAMPQTIQQLKDLEEKTAAANAQLQEGEKPKRLGWAGAWDTTVAAYQKADAVFTSGLNKTLEVNQQIGDAILNSVLQPITDTKRAWEELMAAFGKQPPPIYAPQVVMPSAPAGANVPTAEAAVPQMQAGGIVDKSILANIGEAGKEAVIPLEGHKSRAAQLLEYAREAVHGRFYVPPWMMGGAGGYLTFGGKGGIPQAAGGEVPEPYGMSGAGQFATAFGAGGLLRMAGKWIGERAAATYTGGTHVNFSPNVTVHGGASDEQQRAMDKRLRELADDFIRDFKLAQHQERRLSYESGY